MRLEVQLTRAPIPAEQHPPAEVCGQAGAWVEFRGNVRDEEAGRRIAALEYEAYDRMAVAQTEKILRDLAARWPCLAARVIHRVGVIPVGETALYAGVAAAHRAEAFALLAAFVDRLKQDVPIWKRRALEEA